MSGLEKLKCVGCKSYLLDGPVQCSCGDRMCSKCFSQISRAVDTFECPQCGARVIASECFKDKAVMAELKEFPIPCANGGCTWQGSVDEYLRHLRTCQHSVAALSGESLKCGDKCTCKRHRFKSSKYSCSENDVDGELEGCEIQTWRQQLMMKEIEDKLTLHAQEISDLRSEINYVLREISVKLQPIATALGKAENAIQNLQEGFSELALMVQTLQATSYNGNFIWKIPKVQRRRHEAKIGKTISLYSAPFYTSRQGYKACLRLYMNGDGCGKNTHLSFFVTIMKGEYDALLQWPFRRTVTLTLLDQDGVNSISQAFQPEPTSSSFQRPRNEMNIASGCPMFAPLSILNNSSYVKEDTMFLKCEIEVASSKN